MKKKLRRVRQTADYRVFSHQSGTGVLSCIMQLLLIYLAVLSTVLCVSTSLAMTVSIGEIILICLFTTLLFAAAFFNKITTGIATGLTALAAFVLIVPLQSFFKTLEKAFVFCYDLAFVIMKMRGWNYTSNMITSEEEIAALLDNELLITSYFRSVIVVLAVFYALWYVALSWKRPRVWSTVAVSLAVMVPGFMIGLVPSPVAFSMLLASAFGLYVQTLSSKYLSRTTFKEWWANLFKKRKASKRFAYTMKSGLYGICCAGASLCVMLLVALFTMSTPLIELDQIREYLDEGSRYVYNQVFYSRLETPDNAIGNMIEGDTLDVLKIPKIHKVPVLYVSSEKNEEVYLRAWVSDTFTKDGWSVLNEQDDADYKRTIAEGTDPYTFAYQLHKVFVFERLEMESQESYGFEMDTLEIKARFKKSLVAHLPSYGAGENPALLKGANMIAGEMVSFEKKRPSYNTYSVESFVPIITSKGYVGALHGLAQKYRTLLTLDTSDIQSKAFQTFKKQERSYYQYVKRHYLNTNGITVSFENKAAELAKDHKSQLTKVLAIEKYFRDNTKFTYTLKPEQLKDDTIMQQLEYSLNSKHEGYCTYYATAMTLMVRSLGYPARYVNGYYMKDTAEEPNSKGVYKRTVRDSDCHAWVEVYFDGLGWMCFDPTPNPDETAEEFSARYYAIDLENEPADGDGKGDKMQQIVTTLNVAEQPDDNEIMPQLEIDYGIFGGKGLQILLFVVIVLVALLAATVSLVLYIKAWCHAKKRFLSVNLPEEDGVEPDANLLVCRMHRMILRWLKLKGISRQTDETEYAYAQRVDQLLQTDNSFAELVAIFQKGEFSEQEVVEDQLHKVQIYYNELYYKLHHKKGRLPWWQKLKV